MFNFRFLIVAFFILSIQSIAKENSRLPGNCSSDSTIVTTTFKTNDAIPSTFFEIDIAIYDLDSGVVDSSSQTGLPWTSPANFSVYWNDVDTVWNLNGQVDEILIRTGSSSGWQNSTSQTFVYSLTGKLIESVNRSWNGSSWDSVGQTLLQYDGLDRLTLTESYLMNAGNWENSSRTEIVYVGDHPYSKTLSNGNINAWEYDSLFVFSYLDSLRTNLDVSIWDTLTNTWSSVAQVPYLLQNGDWSARLVLNTPIVVSGIPTVDTLVYDLDTLENVVYTRHAQFTMMDTVNVGWNEAFEDIHDYNHYQGEVKLYQSSYRESFMYIDAGDTLWDNYFRAIVATYTYDQQNRLIHIDYTGGCTNPCGGFSDYVYDSTGWLADIHDNNWTMVSDRNTYVHRSHSDSSTVAVFIPDWDRTPAVCSGSSYQPHLQISGGCAPYQIHWYPSSGLSSDSVSDPSIEVNDSITYTIIVIDNAGHTDTTFYNIYPILQPGLMVDTSGCTNLGVLSTTPVPNFTAYQWYANGIAIPGADSSGYVVDQPGDYSVVMQTYYYSQYYGSGNCSQTSDTISVSLPEVFQSGDSLYTNLFAVTYEWYFNGNLYSSGSLPYVIADQSGNYSVILIDSDGCERESTIYPVITSGIVSIGNESVRVYPNPAKNDLTVQLISSDVEAQIYISDVTGKIVLHQAIGNGNTRVPLSELSNGIYFIRIATSNTAIYQKVVVEK